ncbi:MAG: hypothetical protein KA795_03325 [Burkholderiaceae bacterium]|nr:hypothetical protein [Burkholderiaceae bacterium]
MSESIRNDPPRRPLAPPPAARSREPGAARGSDTVDARLRADAQALGATLAALAEIAPASEHRPDDSQQESGEDRRQPREQAAVAEAAPAQQLDQRLVRIGQFVTHVHQASPEQGSWSLSLPLDDELLPDTVLHLGYAPALVTLHFETRDWTSRDLLAQRTAALEKLVQQLLPPGCDVVVSV